MIHLADCIRISEELVTWLDADSFTVIEKGEYPACAVNIAGIHFLLIRHFGSSFTISLPTKTSFSCQTAEELRKEIPAIMQSVAEYRSKYPQVVTIADAVLQLRPAVLALHDKWILDIPGTPVPSEAWLNSNQSVIGLFQEEASVRVVVWVGTEMRSFTISSTERLGALAKWVIPQLRDQEATATKTSAAETAAAAIAPPSLEAVMAALQKGVRMQLGGGRWYQTYFITNGKLRRQVFDEGTFNEEDAMEEEFVESIRLHAAQARRAILGG